MITFTDAAKDKVKHFIGQTQQQGMSLRIRITGKSKDRFQYSFTLEDYTEEKDDDIYVRKDGFSTRLDPYSARHMEGATIDWEQTDTQPGFAVRNPNIPESGDNPEDLRKDIIFTLKTIYDPEIPANIYDLGLIYSIDIADNKNVVVTMTLTTPNCPVADSLVEEVRSKVANLPGVEQARVDLTWEPPWEKDMMTEAARLQLGI